MTQKFDEMAAQRDPLYAATRARTLFLRALVADEDMAECQRIGGLGGIVVAKRVERDAWLLKLTVLALRNQGQPYYAEAQLTSNRFIDCLFLQEQKVQP